MRSMETLNFAFFLASKDATEKGESFQYFIRGYDVPRMFGYAKDFALVMMHFVIFPVFYDLPDFCFDYLPNNLATFCYVVLAF